MLRFLAALSAALLASSPVFAQTIKVRLAHAASDQHPFHRLTELFKQSVEKKTGGKVEVQLYGNRQLGDDRQVLEATVSGTLDASLASSVLFPLVVKKPAFDAFQLPFLISSYDTLAQALTSSAALSILADLDAAGLKGLSIGEAGLRHFLSSRGPVKAIEDLKGLKTRIVPVPLHKAMWEAVGTNPVGIAYGEVYTSLQTKVIDAVEINISSIDTENLWEAAKFASLTGHYFWPGVIAYNKAKFDQLPADVQKAMIEAGREIIVPQVQFTKADEAKRSETLQKRGVSISPFKDLAKMREAMKPILAQWSAKDPKIAAFIAEVDRIEKR